jgi:hypothetical protein
MRNTIRPDQLHRLVKLALDTGEAVTLEEAEQLFASYRLAIDVGRDVANSPTLQAAVLTAVNAGRRAFLGGVEVAGPLEVALRVPWGRCRTLAEAIHDLHGRLVPNLEVDVPRVVVGDNDPDLPIAGFAVRATFDGWSGGVSPLSTGGRLPERHEFVPAGILAGAVAVSEAFQFVRGGNAAAGRRDVGLSLWLPDPEVSWLDGERGPTMDRLPSRVWVIGLGHLGQAFLWALGLLPYAQPADVQLVLQDYDTLVEANESTSLLTTQALVGEKKARAMARWCEARGFRTTIVERLFAPDFRVAPDEPSVAVCGVDNALARAALGEVGFGRVIEAGLGSGTLEYLAFQVHTFPAGRSARARWAGKVAVPTEGLVQRPAYRALADAGVDECGLTTLAGRTVGAPFVGAATAAIMVAELLRMVMGEHRYEVVDGSLRSLEHRMTVRAGVEAPFNPGSSRAA